VLKIRHCAKRQNVSGKHRRHRNDKQMTTYKKYILTILTFLCSLTLFAESKLAVFNDPDGFIYVRSRQCRDFKVFNTLYKDDFFYFQFVNNSDWAKVTAWKGRQIEGFVYKNRIQEVEKLDNAKQKQLITKVLNRQKVLADSFQNAWKSKDNIAYRITVKELEFYNTPNTTQYLSFCRNAFVRQMTQRLYSC